MTHIQVALNLAQHELPYLLQALHVRGVIYFFVNLNYNIDLFMSMNECHDFLFDLPVFTIVAQESELNYRTNSVFYADYCLWQPQRWCLWTDGSSDELC